MNDTGRACDERIVVGNPAVDIARWYLYIEPIVVWTLRNWYQTCAFVERLNNLILKPWPASQIERINRYLAARCYGGRQPCTGR